MKRIIKLTESDLEKIVKRVLNEQIALPTIKLGQNGNEVEQLQLALKNRKYNLGNGGKNQDGVDGYFGQRTERAVKSFQKSNNLRPTGEVDQMTRNLIFANTPNTLDSLKPLNLRQKSVKKLKNSEKKSTEDKPINLPGMFVDCVKNSPKKKEVKLSNGSSAIIIDGHYFYKNGRVKTPEGKLGQYFCYENGVRIKDDEGNKTYVETGVKTEHKETELITTKDGIKSGIVGFFRKMFPNAAEIFSTKPLTSEDITEPQKQVMFDVIQNAIKRGQNRRKGCTVYADYGPDIEQELTKKGGATTQEMILGTGVSNKFRIATLFGRFCYELQPNGSYYITDDYDFSKWSQFTVHAKEVQGMSYPQKIGYIMDKTGLGPYGAIRHIGWLEHPDNAPAWSKTKLTVKIDPGYFAKLDKKKNPTDSPDNTAVA
jgi:peptidoglycan hydrolase-like protein with peptidoglycan-binding domain